MTTPTSTDDLMYIAVERLQPNRYQPRKDFKQQELEDLSDSIERNGLIQPITIRAIDDGPGNIDHEIIAGERRWRAVKFLEKKRISAILKKEATDESSMQLALIENIQREDLNPLEESVSIKHFMDLLKLTQEQAAQRLGKSRTYISNIVRIDNLSEPAKELLREKKLEKWHATVLLGIKDNDLQAAIAKKAADGKWTVDTLKKRIAAETKEHAPVSSEKPPEKKLGPATTNIVLLEAPSNHALKEIISILKEEGGWNFWEGTDALRVTPFKKPKLESKEDEPKKMSPLRRRAATRKKTTEDLKT